MLLAGASGKKRQRYLSFPCRRASEHFNKTLVTIVGMDFHAHREQAKLPPLGITPAAAHASVQGWIVDGEGICVDSWLVA